MLLAAQVLLLRRAMQVDLCLLEAQQQALRKAQREAQEAVAKRAEAFQRWCRHKASLRAAVAANALLMASEERLKSCRKKRPLWIRFSFCASTSGKVTVEPRGLGRRILEPQMASYGLSVWGYVHLEWPAEKAKSF